MVRVHILLLHGVSLPDLNAEFAEKAASAAAAAVAQEVAGIAATKV
jgi:hypothetical protein